MMQDLRNYFLNAITSVGMCAPSCIIADGQIHRFYNGKRNSKTAWYVFNGVTGVFGDWRSGEKHWFYPSDVPHINVDLSELKRQATKLTCQRDKELKLQQTQSRIAANAIWSQSRVISVHPYLINKAVRSFGLREYSTGELIVPGYNVLDELTTLQFIDGKGRKRFFAKSQVGGSYFTIGYINDVLCVAEGYATAATIHQATGYSVAVAFNDSNLIQVTKICRLKYPKVKIIVCADDDFETNGNPGLTKARQAALENHVYLAVPAFSDARQAKATDFNDMSKISGDDSVKEAIYNAKRI